MRNSVEARRRQSEAMNRRRNAPRSTQATSKVQSPRQRSIVPAVTTPRPPAKPARLVETDIYVARNSGGGSRVISLFAAVVAAVLATPPNKLGSPSQRRTIRGEASSQNRGTIDQTMWPPKSTRAVPTRSTSPPAHQTTAPSKGYPRAQNR